MRDPEAERSSEPVADPGAGRADGQAAAPEVEPVADPALGLLLDPDRLSRLVGRPVRAAHLRPKPGVSHTAALRDPATDEPVGWVQILLGDARVKADKAGQRAARAGLGDRVSRRELADLDATVVWGPLAADPELTRVLRGIDLSASAVLRYNPLRRVVLRLDGYVVRVTADPHRDRLTSLAARLTGLGLPVQTPVATGEAGVPDDDRVSAWRWVEGHDLAHAATADQVAAAGELLARLHAVPVAELPDLPARGWADQLRAAEASVEQLASLTGGPAEAARAAVRLLRSLPEPETSGADVVLHGDFSLDQCFAADGSTDLVLGDLDRAARGPAEIDLASARAVALVDGLDDRPLLAAYVGASGGPGVDAGPGSAPERAAQLRPWVAAALLARVVEPWRAQGPGWADEVRRRGRLALDLLVPLVPREPREALEPLEPRETEGVGWRVPAVVTAPSGEQVRVRRAWPDKVVDGVARVAVEGPDDQGRLRAGTVDRAGRVRLHAPGEDRRLPALARLSTRTAPAPGRLVVHRSGRRAVVELPDRFVKVVRAGRGPGLAEAAETGRRLALAAGLEAPAVLAADDDSLTLARVPGRPVHELSTEAPEVWATIWQGWAQAWARLQAADPAGLTPHTAQDEAEVLRTWRGRAEVAGVLHGTAWGERLEATADLLRGGGGARGSAPDGTVSDTASGSPPDDAGGARPRLVPTHRDLHDKQLLWHEGTLAVLDFDTACAAEPALDLANLRVHARLRRAQGVWSAAAAQVVQDAVDAVAQGSAGGASAGGSVLDRAAQGSIPPVEPDRMRLAERATVARLAAVYAFRPPWRDLVLDWAEAEWRVLT